MVAGGPPTPQVLLDDGTGTFPYDATSYVRLVDGIKISRGREDEQSDVTAGQCTVVFDNSTGAFTLGSTVIASPSPITIDNRLRVKYTANATAFDRHTGYLISDPVSWPTGGDLESRVSVTLTDAQARAERRPLKSYAEEEIIADSPLWYYPLSEPIGATVAVDHSGNQQPQQILTGSGSAVSFGTADGTTTDSLTAASFVGGQYLNGDGGIGFSFGTPPYTVVLAFTTSGSGTVMTLFGNVTGTGPLVGVDATGHLMTSIAGGLASTATVNDGQVHVATITFSNGGGTNVRLYLDGVLVASGSELSGAAGTRDIGKGFIGSISHVAMVFGTGPSPTRVAAYASAMLNGFAGESGTARITRLAGYAGIPIGTLDTSLTNVGFTDITNSSAWDAIKDAVDAEVGDTYVNGSGALDFHNRNRAVSKTAPDATVAAEFLAEDTSFAVDLQGVINYFEVTSSATGVTQVVRNTTSELGDGSVTHPGHGRYPGSASYLVTTDAEALDRANWIVANHAEPQPRAGTLTLDLLTMTAAQQAACLALEADSWLRITGLPSQTPNGTTGDFVVQGIAADTLTLTSWTLALNVVSRSLFAPVWILGDSTYSVLGSTTRLYV